MEYVTLAPPNAVALLVWALYMERYTIRKQAFIFKTLEGATHDLNPGPLPPLTTALPSNHSTR
ncbi:hypothetical protein TorRG33x02_080780 [Trema orientale]|uniref:Uncharacterized protein n=1 Tax=Trema orientale TaxID=63057 RepID=A0A2P5FEC9_TREOI|nr:hypothetical protein TorRG33x02_080780 [Trema orientale]